MTNKQIYTQAQDIAQNVVQGLENVKVDSLHFSESLRAKGRGFEIQYRLECVLGTKEKKQRIVSWSSWFDSKANSGVTDYEKEVLILAFTKELKLETAIFRK